MLRCFAPCFDTGKSGFGSLDVPIAWHYACGEIMLADDATHSDWVVWFGGSLAFLVSSGTVWFWSVGSYFGVLLSHVSGSGCD